MAEVGHWRIYINLPYKAEKPLALATGSKANISLRYVVICYIIDVWRIIHISQIVTLSIHVNIMWCGVLNVDN